MLETQRHAEFPATQWSIVLRAGGSGTADTRRALEDLCRAYWPPLYAFLRRDGRSAHDAKDIVQGFLARLLERRDLEAVGPERGRFRSYLLAGLRNFLVSEVRREQAQKRGGTAAIFSIDAEDAEVLCARAVASELTPDRAFDRRWAETILDRAVEALRREHFARGKNALFEVLKSSLAGAAAEDHATWARQLGMTPGAIAVAVHRMRTRLRELVRLEVAHTVNSPSDVDAEMKNLLAILAG